MLENFFYNPIACIFISYAIGAILTDAIKHSSSFRHFQNRNYLNDVWTKRIGALVLGWLIRNTFMGLFNKKLKLKGKASKAELEQLILDMDYAETGHLIGFIFLLIVNIGLAIYGFNTSYLVIFFLLNIIFNFHLVLLQQYNKRRIRKVLSKYN